MYFMGLLHDLGTKRTRRPGRRGVGRQQHVAGVFTALGCPGGHQQLPATAHGYRRMPAWAQAFRRLTRAGAECTGSYGAALSGHVLAAGIGGVKERPDSALTD
jgi:transposase